MEWNIPHIRAMCDPWVYKQQFWSSDEEAQLLHDLTLQSQVVNVVEIGTGFGFLSVCFAHAGATVQTFDRLDRPKTWNHDEWPWPELNDRITAKVLPSPECFEGLVVPPGKTLWFVDGDHSEQAADRDTNLVLERIQSGDILALHDVTGEVGPRRVWARFQRAHKKTETWETKNGVGIYVCE